jgi:hypothetical protein
MIAGRRARPHALCIVALAALPCCTHRPRHAELHVVSRDEALRRCELALKTRYARIIPVHLDDGCLQTDERYTQDDSLIRSRAFIVITPGEHGWAAEITVLRERLDADAGLALSPSARWVRAGRDAEMEEYLASSLEAWLRNPPPVFESVSAESAPASTPASGR